MTESNIHMAVDMMEQSVYRALMERETAVKVLIPDIADRNTALMTALTLAFGKLLMIRGGPERYLLAVEMFGRMLVAKAPEFEREARKQWAKQDAG